MYKTLVIGLLIGGAATVAQAGTLPGVSLSGAPLITVKGSYSQADPLQTTITIKNTSGRSLTLGLQRQIRSEVAGSENNFCFGINCYPPSVTTSPSPITLADGASDESAILDYTPNNKPGVTTIRYAVYEVGKQDSAYVTVKYDASTAVLASAAIRASESVLSQPWPNPALGGAAQLRYTLPAGTTNAYLVLVSLADGRRQRETRLGAAGSTQTVNVSTTGLAAGHYSCLLIAGDGRLLAVRRLVIN